MIGIYQITGERPCFIRCSLPLSDLVTVLLPLPTNWGGSYCWERTSAVARLPSFPSSPKAEESGEFWAAKANVEWLSGEWDLSRDMAPFLRVAFVVRRADVHGNGFLNGG